MTDYEKKNERPLQNRFYINACCRSAATIVAYALERPYFSAVFSCSGAFLAFLGIIFATCSKPKKRKRHLVTDEIVAENDDINKISENSVDNEE